MYNPYSNKKELTPYVRKDLDLLKEELDKAFGFNILSKSRKRKYVDARKVFVNILNDKYDLKSKGANVIKLLTTSLLAEYIGVNNHSSILHLLRNFDVLINYSSELKIIYQAHSYVNGDFDNVQVTLLKKRLHYMDLISQIDIQLEELKNAKKEKLKEDITRGYGNELY
tara:strand:- start:4613 stop:5119 length:507 start_codon:yes stop_codon:yes gene_type:complete